MAVAGISAFADFRQQQPFNRKPDTMTQNDQPSTDTIPAPFNSSFNFNSNGKAYKLVVTNNLPEYYVDGKQVTEQEMRASHNQALEVLNGLAEAQRGMNNTGKGLENTRSGLNTRRDELETVRDNLGNVKDGLESAAKNSADVSAQIIDDLLKDKIVTDKQHAIFSISADKMTVNGKELPSNIHSRYKLKYLKDPLIILSNQ
jgi:hypothetical protein